MLVRTLPGNTSSLLGGVSQGVGDVGNALMAKYMKVDSERMNTEVQTTKIRRTRYIYLSETWKENSIFKE